MIRARMPCTAMAPCAPTHAPQDNLDQAVDVLRSAAGNQPDGSVDKGRWGGAGLAARCHPGASNLI